MIAKGQFEPDKNRANQPFKLPEFSRIAFATVLSQTSMANANAAEMQSSPSMEFDQAGRPEKPVAVLLL